MAARAAAPVYLPADVDAQGIARELATVLDAKARAAITLMPLPRDATSELAPAGLLYLPAPYVVPGGRFNEMYGWDSYFIVLGLVRDGLAGLARDQTDDFLYEVDHYGKVLNANRTYYLSRSQPPLLSGMVRAVWDARGTIPDGRVNRTWLAHARDVLGATHRFWTTPPHLAGDTGLSRYFDSGDTPAPEVLSDERDAAGRTHYDRVQAVLRDAAKSGSRLDPDFDVEQFYDRATDRLKPDFYRGDRSMRESGFDPSNRFGPFGLDVTNYAPICLNTLLAVLEADLAAISEILGDDEDAHTWRARRDDRAARINRYLWDEAAGLYFDWNTVRGRRRIYPFATTFWPLAAGIATPAQAARVRKNLGRFERPGGIETSDRVTGNQWDAPFGWAPLELFAIWGLERAGFHADAVRVARAFTSLVTDDFTRRQTLVEKYDVRQRSSAVEGAIKFGYSANQVGFGWTNGVFLELVAFLNESPASPRRADAVPAPL